MRARTTHRGARPDKYRTAIDAEPARSLGDGRGAHGAMLAADGGSDKLAPPLTAARCGERRRLLDPHRDRLARCTSLRSSRAMPKPRQILAGPRHVSLRLFRPRPRLWPLTLRCGRLSLPFSSFLASLRNSVACLGRLMIAAWRQSLGFGCNPSRRRCRESCGQCLRF